MKILLVGNYKNSQQQSMQRFAELMHQGLEAKGHEVRLVHPPVVLGRLCHGETGLAKWLGYIDRFLLYPFVLWRQTRRADVVHICDQANAVYIPCLGAKPHVITCHDMLAIRAALGDIPESPTGWTGKCYQRWILRSLRKTKLVACVSRQTRNELREFAELGDDRIIVVHNGLNYPYRQMAPDEALPFLKILGLAGIGPFFFHVGGNQWYKNRRGVLHIFAVLIKRPGFESHSLVMAGKPWTMDMKRIVNELGIEERVIELENITNEELCALYSMAQALLFPSFQEGFGWPIVEAQACGCPVITSDRAPMTEVGGEAAVYIDPADLLGGVDMAVAALGDGQRWRIAGRNNAGRFSREVMIDAYIECYRSALQQQAPETMAGTAVVGGDAQDTQDV